MTKAFVTLATGSHEELLRIAMPSFEEFADRHDYEIVTAQLESDRAPSWLKVAALIQALREFEEALWVDADVVITDPREDMDVPEEAWQALVEHRTGDGDVPNCAVWYVRQPMRPILQRIWNKVEYLEHGWWEQAALHNLMGYRGRPLRLKAPTTLYDHTFFLDTGWNMHCWDANTTDHPRFMHATMYDDRAETMRQWAGMVRA